MNKPAQQTELRPSPSESKGVLRHFAPLLAGPWVFALLVLLALAPYAGNLRNDFAYMYDDKAQILDNPYVHGFGHLREVLTTSVWSYAGAQALNSYYRPVMTLGFLLCYWVFGPSAWGFHLVSLLLHAAVVLMLFLFAARLFRDRGAAFATAALFALHPIHTEPVAWISAVTDLEVTFFFLLTFTCYLMLEGRRGRALFAMQAATGLSFLLALLSKEQALTLVFLAIIFEHFCRDDRLATSWSGKVGRYAPLAVLAVAYVLARVFALGAFAPATSMRRLTMTETILSALALLGQYSAKLIWTAHLSAFYVFHVSHHFWEPEVLGGVAALIVCALAFALLWKKSRPAAFGILWILVTLSPVLNAGWMGPYVQADRYLYLPSVGFCLTVGWAIAALWRRAVAEKPVWRWAAAAGMCAVAGFCILRIAHRIPDWRDDITLFSRTLVDEPNEFILHDALGDAYWIRGQDAPAELEWKKALQINPAFVRPVNALGALYAKQRRYAEAEEYLERATALTPGDAVAHMNLGSLYAETGRADRAEQEFQAAVAASPMNFTAHNLLGKVYFDSNRLTEAEQQFRQSLACEPNLAAYDHLGYIYSRSGDRGRAEQAFRAALAIDSSDSHAHFNLGRIYAATGRNAQAAEELQAALAADPNNSEIRTALEKLRH